MQTPALTRIGATIRAFRKSRNLTLEQFAELTDSTVSYIGTIERGEQNITIQTLDKIAQAFDIDIFDLLSISQVPNETLREVQALLMQQDGFHQKKFLAILKEFLRNPENGE